MGFLKHAVMGAAWIAAVLFASTPAFAVPSYSRQTGDPCTSCHVGGYGPQLTPHGRAFKLGGYSDGKTVVPLSATLLASFTHTAKDQAEPISGHDGRNDNVALQEVVGFIAGRFAPHFGGFIGVEHSEIERAAMLDHFDVRYAQPLKLGGKDAILGFDINNNPTSQDPFDTLPAWSFPHAASDLVPERLGSTLLAEGLEGKVVGLSTYLWLDDSIYAEIGGYRSLSHGLLGTIGVEDEAGRISGIAPYGRLAYQKNWGKQVASIGLVALRASILPERLPGPTNRYTDCGMDAAYQYLGNRKNIFSFNASYIRERQRRNFDVFAGDTSRSRHSLNSLNTSLSWYHNNSYGLTAALFRSRGSRDTDLYAPEEDGGSRTGRPDTDGYILQADWVPFGKEGSPAWANMRLGLQYTGYLKFNGATHDYDGFGRDASDNNTIFGFVEVAF